MRPSSPRTIRIPSLSQRLHFHSPERHPPCREQPTSTCGCVPYSSPQLPDATARIGPADGVPVFSNIFAQTQSHLELQLSQASLRSLSHGLQAQLGLHLDNSYRPTHPVLKRYPEPFDPRRHLGLALLDSRHRFCVTLLGTTPPKIWWVSRAKRSRMAVFCNPQLQPDSPSTFIHDDQELPAVSPSLSAGVPDLLRLYRRLDPRKNFEQPWVDPTPLRRRALGTLGTLLVRVCDPAWTIWTFRCQKNDRYNERFPYANAGLTFSTCQPYEVLHPRATLRTVRTLAESKARPILRLVQLALTVLL